jgi:hypothetical protein
MEKFRIILLEKWVWKYPQENKNLYTYFPNKNAEMM